MAFATSAAVLSAALATVTFVLVDHYLLDQQLQNATHEAYADARLARRDLLQGGPNIADVLSSLTEPAGSAAYLYQDGVWYSGALAFGYGPGSSRPLGVPQPLAATVRTGQPARQIVVVNGQPAVTVGVPLPAVGADFFDVYSLAPLSRTLSVLAWVLVASAAATALAGLVLGRWASGRLVRPIREVAGAAAAIARGDLDERLPSRGGRELELLSQSFNDMAAALQERIERDARFASDVSHELRSPLTTLQAGAELLQSAGPDLPPDARQAVELLAAEVSRFSAMVQDLLEMSRFDAGAADLDLEDVAIDELVAGTVAAYTGASVPVVVAPEAKGAQARADRRRLQRVLVNLLDNAEAHGGGAVAVRVSLPCPGEVELSVEDAGPGVAPAERAAIFERFYRGAAAGRRGAAAGTGLGLSLVAQHVKAHGGTVEVTDRPGGGARFSVRLPVARDTVPTAAGAKPAGAGAKPAGGGAKPAGGGLTPAAGGAR